MCFAVSGLFSPARSCAQAAASVLMQHWQPDDVEFIVSRGLHEVARSLANFVTGPGGFLPVSRLEAPSSLPWQPWSFSQVRVKLFQGLLSPAELIEHMKVLACVFMCVYL
jgi:hypothetical protein